jgi:hypothetical protein
MRPQKIRRCLVIITSMMVLISCENTPLDLVSTPYSPLITDEAFTISTEPIHFTQTPPIPSPSYTIIPTAKPSSSHTIIPTIEPSLTSTKTPTAEPTPDIIDPSAIAAWFNHALKKGDLSPFELFLPDSPLIWIQPAPDGPNVTCDELLGQWCDISKSDFLEQISLRINNNLSCFYSGGSNVFTIEISGWDPKWPMPDWESLLGEVDRLQLLFTNHNAVQGEYSLTELTFLAAEFLWRAKDPCP